VGLLEQAVCTIQSSAILPFHNHILFIANASKQSVYDGWVSIYL